MKKVSENFYVSPQIEPSKINGLSKDEFDIVVCNRPDDEEPNQPSKIEISNECQEKSLEFIDLEMVPGDINFETINRTKEILDTNKKVFAYCRTGTRSITLWAFASCYTKEVVDIISEANNAGYELAHLKDIFVSFKSSLS